MSKKVRRVRRRRVEQKPVSEESSLSEVSSGGRVTSASSRTSASTEEELRKEYAYVLQDLRRVFILAAAMFALLIILNILLG
jgi:hypothetical protein